MIKVGSDFSGVGAFNQALMRLGIDYEEIFACDMDKYARDTFIHNYGEPKYYPKNVYEREIPSESLDIYMTSPPCQAFSLAGKRLGKDDKRGILFFSSYEFIQVNKPRYFIFENVKGLLSDDNGRTFQEWINMLGGKSVNGVPVIFPYDDSVPYHIYWKVINAKDFNVPQNRERVFIVGIRDDEDNNFSWAIEQPLTRKLKDVLESEVDKKYFLSEKLMLWISKHRCKRDSKNKYPLDDSDISYCMTARYGKNGAEDPYIKVHQINSSLESGGKQPYQQNRIYDSNGLSTALCREKSDLNVQIETSTNYKIRRLTPRECFRLMDFPDTFTWEVSDSQAYKQAGNSIVVAVLESIINKLNLCQR